MYIIQEYTYKWQRDPFFVGHPDRKEYLASETLNNSKFCLHNLMLHILLNSFMKEYWKSNANFPTEILFCLVTQIEIHSNRKTQGWSWKQYASPLNGEVIIIVHKTGKIEFNRI